MSRFTILFASIVVGLVFTPALQHSARGCPQTPKLIRAVTEAAEDQVDVSATRDLATCSVQSPRGIGRATLHRAEMVWPDKVVLHLHLAGLESLRITHNEKTIAVSVLSSGDHRVIQSLTQGDQPRRELDSTSKYWVRVRRGGATGEPKLEIPLEGGYFEVTIPPILLESNPESIQLHWIDFHRSR